MTSGSGGAAARLALRLRELREHQWDDLTITQALLAAALGAGAATVSSYESVTAPKKPTKQRLTAYAQFFATRRSVQDKRLVDLDDLTPDEREQFDRLRNELISMHDAIGGDDASSETKRRLLDFEGSGAAVVVVCPEAPADSRGPLADVASLNHTRLHRFADADALLEVFGHIRALNPTLKVLRRLPSEVDQADLQNHIVLIGGIAWNSTIRRILSDVETRLPIEQVDDKRAPEGDVFRVKKGKGREEQTHLPVVEINPVTGRQELVEDVGLLARLPNPFNFGRTMTICNGIYSKGVLGTALAISDETVRPTNEQYLAQRFPRGNFAMLVRVPVWSGHPIAADLQNPRARLFEWSPEPTAEE